jgi:hypothetical protein
MSIPAIEELVHRALDVTFPTDVEIAIDNNRQVLYIHIEGATILRINGPLAVRFTKDGDPASLQAVYE